MPDPVKDSTVPGIVRAVELSVVDREAVVPEVEDSCDTGGFLGLLGFGVVDDLAGGVVAAESAGCACEVGGPGFGFLFFFLYSRCSPTLLAVGFVKLEGYLLLGLLDDLALDVVWVLDSQC